VHIPGVILPEHSKPIDTLILISHMCTFMEYYVSNICSTSFGPLESSSDATYKKDLILVDIILFNLKHSDDVAQVCIETQFLRNAEMGTGMKYADSINNYRSKFPDLNIITQNSIYSCYGLSPVPKSSVHSMT
jgi:hypothetical protein